MEGLTPGRILHPAYVAGIIDGEGCISIYKTQAKSGNAKYQLQVAVVMREGWLMEMIKDQYGGNVRRDERNHKLNENHSVVYRWRVGDLKAKAFLKEILPYLRAKSVQAQLALHFSEQKHLHLRADPTSRLIQQDCYHAVRYENRTGVGK